MKNYPEFLLLDRQKSANEGSINFPPFSPGWLSYAEPIISLFFFFFFFFTRKHTKSRVIGKKGSSNRFLIDSCP